MTEMAFQVVRPVKDTSCLVFASPHSGRDYPWSFIESSVLDKLAIRSSEDAFVDQLFDCAPNFGARFLAAKAPRAYVDLNRAAEELDPALIEGVRAVGHNPRIASGLGVIPRVVSNGRAIYRGKMTPFEAEHRIATYWRPYHETLQTLLDEAMNRHGQAVLIDCHSMPHEAMDGVVRKGVRRPEIVLGDRFGASSAGDVIDRIETALLDAGFAVTRNSPFAGAYVVQQYGRPARGQHAIQIEIDRSLYMDEAKIAPHSGFAELRARLKTVIADITRIGQERRPLAAE